MYSWEDCFTDLKEGINNGFVSCRVVRQGFKGLKGLKVTKPEKLFVYLHWFCLRHGFSNGRDITFNT